MTGHIFDDHSDVYEALVNWPKRLAREGEFYQGLFHEHGVQRVLDVACGTGHHAAMFHRWGLQVDACDANPAMIQRARQTFGEGEGLSWSVRPFEQTEASDPRPDAILCVGNSLALAPDEHVAQVALQKMLAAVRPGGLVVLHVLNLQSLPDGPCVWQKCIAMSRSGRQVLVTKGVQRSGQRGYVNLIISTIDPPGLVASESVPLLYLTEEQFSRWARDRRASRLHCFGNYQRASFDASNSTDLIVVLRTPRHQPEAHLGTTQ